jgi:anti-anti-sigma factor
MSASSGNAGGAHGGAPDGDGSGLEIDVVRRDEELVLVVAGEIDTATSPELGSRLSEVPSDAVVTLDLSAVSFVDSSGLSVLIAAHQRQLGNGGRLSLRSVNETVARLFVVTGLDRHLDIVET